MVPVPGWATAATRPKAAACGFSIGGGDVVAGDEHHPVDDEQVAWFVSGSRGRSVMVAKLKARKRSRSHVAAPGSTSVGRSKRLSPDYSTLSVYLERDTHRRFKARSALDGRTMSEIVETAIEAWLSGKTELS
jgi:hypothetical protein